MVLIWVVIKINDQIVFLSNLASQRRFNSFTNLPFMLLSEAATGGVLSKKGVLRNFAKIHRKTPVPEYFFFNKVAGLRPATLFKKRL